jgi:uracil-DNA glycosylase family protein
VIRIALSHPSDLAGWRERARAAMAADLPPDAIDWQVGEGGLFDAGAIARAPADARANAGRVTPQLLELLRQVLAHSDPQRFALAYRLAWRQSRGERDLLADLTDDDVHRAADMAKAVRRDLHKMKAFVRFRAVEHAAVAVDAASGDHAGEDVGSKMLAPWPPGAQGGESRGRSRSSRSAGAAPATAGGGTHGGNGGRGEVDGPAGRWFAAWFEPAHYILDLVAPFFVRRYASMRWSIITPYRSARWDGAALAFGAGGERSAVPAGDDAADLWRTYYASIFNPARLNERMMRQEMPQKYWRNLPEARLIPQLVRDAGQRVQAMVTHVSAPPRRPLPDSALPVAPAITGTMADLRTQAAACRACPLWEPATQVVFGEGPVDARVMVIGEQPGDEEDLGGRPFIGPAGRVFDRALAEAGVDRASLYVTNAVKHFKFEMRGKRRLHRNPERSEQLACRQWLQAELDRLQPERIVCLGGTAAAVVFGREVKVTQERGRWHALAPGVEVMATVHPSYILRLPDTTAREQAYARFRDDLALLRDSAA